MCRCRGRRRRAACGQLAGAQIPGGPFESVLPPSSVVKTVAVAPFELDRRPVTNGMFAQFVRQQPRWQRDRVAKLFADERYLQHWRTSTEVDAAYENQPVTLNLKV